MSTPYIGSRISLISKLDIRYEGVLYSVNTADSTIALVKVRSLGTEDRPVANPVAAREDVYEHIIFKASDIKDLIVCETPKPQPTLGGLPYDPAIVSVSNKPEGPPSQSGGSSRPNTPSARASPGAPAQAPQQLNRAPGPRQPGPLRGAPGGPPQNRGGYVQYRQGGYGQQGGGSYGQQGGGSYGQQGGGYRGNYNQGPQPLLGRGTRGGFNRNPAQNPREKLRYDSDYDFEKANEQFQETLSDLLKEKLNINEEEEEPSEKVEKDSNDEDAGFYDKKSSFFDNISCEALEKQEGRKARPDWRKERETNQETFGHQAVRSLNYRRGFGRGRGGPHRGYNNGYGGFNNRFNGGAPRGGFRRNVNYNNANTNATA